MRALYASAKSHALSAHRDGDTVAVDAWYEAFIRRRKREIAEEESGIAEARRQAAVWTARSRVTNHHYMASNKGRDPYAHWKKPPKGTLAGLWDED